MGPNHNVRTIYNLGPNCYLGSNYDLRPNYDLGPSYNAGLAVRPFQGRIGASPRNGTARFQWRHFSPSIRLSRRA